MGDGVTAGDGPGEGRGVGHVSVRGVDALGTQVGGGSRAMHERPYLGAATSFRDGAYGVFQAIVWPAYFVYEVLHFLQA